MEKKKNMFITSPSSDAEETILFSTKTSHSINSKGKSS